MTANKKEDLVQAFKFLCFSLSAGVIQVAVFSLLELILLPYWISYLVALIASVVWNFTLNREFTFKSANNVPIAMLKVVIFYAIFTPTSTILSQLAVDAGSNEYLVTGITMILNFVLEFLYTRFVVYRKSCDTATKKNEK